LVISLEIIFTKLATGFGYILNPEIPSSIEDKEDVKRISSI
jgi:hypothetical protein